MILVFSDTLDQSCNEVLDWLISSQTPFVRLTEKNEIRVKRFYFSNGLLHSEFEIGPSEMTLRTEEIQGVWFRRFPRIVKNPYPIVNWGFDKHLERNLRFLFSKEWENFQKDFYRTLANIPSLGNCFEIPDQTLSDLQMFQEAGGSIPNTTLVSNKSDLNAFLNANSNECIVKKYNVALNYGDNNQNLAIFTRCIDQETLAIIPKSFAPTLIQEKLDKEFEIRTFVLGKKFYSMAIFSQANKETKVDFV